MTENTQRQNGHGQDRQGVVAHLVVKGAIDAIAFYKTALGATEVIRMPTEDGKRLMHAEIIVNGSRVFLVDDFPEHPEHTGGGKIAAPASIGATSCILHLEVPDCDAAMKRAADAGAVVIMPPWDAFWGARYGQVLDPFGQAWSFAHPLPGRLG
jgi:PhnB protein